MYSHEHRAAMVRSQLQARGIRDQRVLDVMTHVPREAFVPDAMRDQAYADQALPIENGQTISQPYVVALMAQSLMLQGDERVLDVGTGSGYAAAVLSRLAGEVYTVERHADLAAQAEERFRALGYTNIFVTVGDGTLGLPAYAPFDAVNIAAASPWVPRPLREQLSLRGRLVIPVGNRNEQKLIRLVRHDTDVRVEQLGSVRFVPLIGNHAWEQDT